MLGQVDRIVQERLRHLLQELVERLSLATSEAVSLRRLTQDGRTLLTVAWYHPDPEVREATGRVVSAPGSVEDSGMWRPVVGGRVVRYHMPAGSLPEQASAAQAVLLARYPLRAIMGAPVRAEDGVLLGGVALIRFARDAPFSDADERILIAFAHQVSRLLALVELD
ncbi:GAF domain-containing protein [Quadrisphaera oryzae]|uniref:GAF domain-containing protein n=1 Tax=Quadrisphaera TaxID=317661 RepID=UPI001647048F|nr:GAF domain-containing protein [Quadrisphaera sp. RL12-1S]MBC3763948.1 GAF domain-containing protein [Quadrisphaera sp. RL12-1S]